MIERILSFAVAAALASAAPASAADNVYEDLVFSKDGSQLASHSYPGQIFVWNINNGKRSTLRNVQTNRIVDMEFSPTDDVLAALYYDLQKPGGILLFDTRKGKEDFLRPVKKLDYRNVNSSLSFSSDGKRLAALIAGPKTRAGLTVAKSPGFDKFSSPAPTPFAFQDGGIKYLKGSSAVIYRTNASGLSLINVDSGSLTQTIDLGCEAESIAVSVKRSLVVVDCLSSDKVRAFSLDSYQFLWEYGDVYSFGLALSADGAEVYDIEFQAVKVRSAFTGVELRSFAITGQSWYSSAASSKGILAVSELTQGAPTSYVIGLYDAKTGQRLRSLD